MFQSFETPASTAATASRVGALRAAMARLSLDAMLVPRTDSHLGEYVPPSGERLRWLTGFSGSAGWAVVTRTSAALFIDGRYRIQAPAEADPAVFEFHDLKHATMADWLLAHLPRDAKVGFDPWHVTISDTAVLAKLLAGKHIALKALGRNPIDALWGKDRPAAPATPIQAQLSAHTGRASADKIADVQAILKAADQDGVVLTNPDSVAWLFNIRARDVAHTPVALAFAYVPATGKPELFADSARFTPAAHKSVKGHVTLTGPEGLHGRMKDLRAQKRRVRLDPQSAAAALGRLLGGEARGSKAGYSRGADPCSGLKARKTAAEIAGARAAHLRDGAAMVRFLAWFDQTAPGGTLDEITLTRKLEAFRGETNALRDVSFATIAGAGENGAIVHYRVNTATNRSIAPGDIVLIDSGGQYLDGTTDITRTVAAGALKPGPLQPGRPQAGPRQRFTLVLKGHIAIATARFPNGTRGIDLDPFARRALWDHGLDYDHGTGHGIGSYLSVHEGPQSISRAGMAELAPGMLLSNEPGYYKTGAYGIRIENVVLVTEPEIPPGGERAVMGFETLSLAPIDRRLIDTDLLSPAETAWVDAYHARVLALIGPLVEPETRAWLTAATAPLEIAAGKSIRENQR